MPTTPRDIVTRAYSKSLKNRPGTIANEASELLDQLDTVLKSIYAGTAILNPTFYATSESVAYSVPDGGWPRPAAAEAVFRIEGEGTASGNVADGVEVVIVPYDDREAEEGFPSVYRMGRVYKPAGNALDPNTNDALTVFYSQRSPALVDLDTAIDSSWPEAYNELLALHIAMYLASKEAEVRQAELQMLGSDRERWAMLYMAFVEHETVNERRRYGHIQIPTSGQIVSARELIMGGA